MAVQPLSRVRASTRGRWARRLVAVAALAAAFVALPAAPGTTAPPTTATRTVAVDRWGAADAAGWLRSEVVAVADLVLVGTSDLRGAELEVRARRGGRFGPWLPLHVDLDQGHGDTSSDPVWLGPSAGFQLRARGRPGPVEVTAVTVRGGAGLAYDPTRPPGDTAQAMPATPQFVPRSEWDPRGECRPTGAPDYTRDLRMAYVHHTAIFPEYTPDQSDDIVRAICLFHVQQRGWSDLGYNFLVDRYGRTFEGRAGGPGYPVVGAHASGFNDHSVGVSVIGDFDRHPVPAAALEAVSVVIAWKAALHRFDPTGWAEVVSSPSLDPELTRHPPGTAVTLPAVAGHLDTALNTECPGRHLYAVLPDIRARAAQLLATWPEVPDPPFSVATDGTRILAAPAVGADAPHRTAGAPTPRDRVSAWAEALVLAAVGTFALHPRRTREDV